jgi:hypothetical protein
MRKKHFKRSAGLFGWHAEKLRWKAPLPKEGSVTNTGFLKTEAF